MAQSHESVMCDPVAKVHQSTQTRVSLFIINCAGFTQCHMLRIVQSSSAPIQSSPSGWIRASLVHMETEGSVTSRMKQRSAVTQYPTGQTEP